MLRLLLYLLVVTDNELGFGPGRLLGELAYSIGLVLVVIAGAELFTGNNPIITAWAECKITTATLLRKWALVYLANVTGAVATVVLVVLAGTLALGWPPSGDGLCRDRGQDGAALW